MSKQPYIPFYVGDYLKDTRVLPLSVRGAWVDLILFMWDNPVRGELIGTIDEVARMIGCDKDEARFALDLLKQKKTADIDLLNTGEFKIVSRRMKRDAEISATRSEVGKKGVEAKKRIKFAEAKGQAKQKQNTDNDIVYDNDIDIDNTINRALDEIYLDQQKPKWPHIEFDFEVNSFKEKVRGSPEHYRNHDSSGLRLAFQSQLRNAKKKFNGTDKQTQNLASNIQAFEQRWANKGK